MRPDYLLGNREIMALQQELLDKKSKRKGKKKKPAIKNRKKVFIDNRQCHTVGG